MRTKRNWLMMLVGAFFVASALGLLRIAINSSLYAGSAIQPLDIVKATLNEAILFWPFFLMGSFVIYIGWRGKKVIVALEPIDKPWLLRAEWKNNNILTDSRPRFYVMAFFAFVFNLFSWIIALSLMPGAYDEEGIGLVIVIAFLPVIGLIYAYLAVKEFLQWNYFGRTPLTMDPFPGAIGGQVGGSIEIASSLSGDDSYKVTLSCVRNFDSYDGGRASVRNTLVWQQESIAMLLSKGTDSVLIFNFDVPEDLPESDLHKEEAWNIWYLYLSSGDQKLDRRFEIPVFATGETSSVRVRIPDWRKRRGDELILQTQLPLKSVTASALLDSQNKSLMIHYPILYKPNSRLIILLAGFMFVTLGVVTLDDISIFTVVFILLGCAFILTSIYHLFKSLTVIMDSHSITSTRRFMGMFPRRQQALVGIINKISILGTISSSSKGKNRTYFQIEAFLNDGGRVLLAEHIEGERAANVIAGCFKRILKLQSV